MKTYYIFFHGFGYFFKANKYNLLPEDIKNPYISKYVCPSCDYSILLFSHPENEKEYCNYLYKFMNSTCKNCIEIQEKYYCIGFQNKKDLIRK